MSLKSAYLIAYNALQTLGWSYILYLSLPLLSDYKSGHLYEATSVYVEVFQTAALLEVVHAALGLVRSNALITAMQVASRLVLTWPVLSHFSEASVNVGFPMLLMAWTITEIIRYAFYTLSLLALEVHLIVYLRYTLFIILYPIGVTGELCCLASTLPRARSEGSLSLRLPNALNMTFDFVIFAVIFALLYIPIFPKLYGHMWVQRRKVLGSTETRDASKKKE